jgi:hypothetical protein
MRKHGVTNFPDPKVTVHGNQVSVMIGINPALTAAPQFKSAQRACQGLMAGAAAPSPQQLHAREQAFLAFARCMRSHGVPRFPDPTNQGQITPNMLSSAGVDLHAPQTLTAGLACASVTHGLITRADVARAVNGSH